MKNTKDLNNLLDMTLTDLMRECAKLGIDYFKHGELIEEMYEDGFDADEIREMVEVIQDREHYAYIPSL